MRIKNKFELSRLKNMVGDRDDIIKDKSLSEGFKNGGLVEDTTQIIDTVGPIADQLTGSTWAQKIAANTGAAGKAARAMAASPIAKKAALALGGPAAMALSTASDAMASEDVGLGSDQVDQLQNEEALMNIPHENFADSDVSEQARRWQKIRRLMEE